MPIFELERSWVIETAHSGYVLGINPEGLLVHGYWGERLPSPQDYPPLPSPAGWASFNNPAHLSPEEYPTYTGMKFTEPGILVTFPDGVRDLVLRFVKAEIIPGEIPELRLLMEDVHYPLRLALVYRVYEVEDLVERSAAVTNLGGEPVTIARIFSACWHLPPGEDYRLTHLAGRWMDEMHIHRETLTPGVKTLESRRLTTSHHHNPWFAVDRGAADEDQGAVWFGALAWSGNWKIAAEVTGFNSTRIHTGINDWDFAWRLNASETFTTPPAVAGYTPHGFGAASRSLHDFIRGRLLPHGARLHPVLYNSWEATAFDVTEAGQARLAEIAAGLGVELFVVDDGWFHGRVDDRTALGDWWPDEGKFPRGLSPLIRKVNALGMDFGLWIEPEMVSPASQLYRDHPDWVIHFPTRERSLGRNQLILNVAREDVQDYLIASFDRLLSEHNITFIKWDMNRNVSEPGWPGAPGDPRELWVRYVQGLYRVWRELAQRHPTVTWQSCSGGGGRADLGILKLADQIWPSDNTAPATRLMIQEGFSQVFPANTMEAWVTDMGDRSIPLSFRFHASMCGTLGIGADISRWSDRERSEAAALVAQYKSIRSIVQQGDLYRLRSPQESFFSALQYVAKDRRESVLFAFRTFAPDPVELPAVFLHGLDPGAQYDVEGVPGARSGAAWMEAGLKLDLGNFESTVRSIRRVP